MKLRAMGALVAAAAAMTALAGCQTKVGQAAVVGGDRISDSTLSTYATRSGPSEEVRANAQQQGQPVQPRVEALTSLIQERVFTHVLAKTGGVPSDAELSALHDEATQRFLGNQGQSADFDALLGKQVKEFGLTPSFTALVIRVAELEDVIVNRTEVASFQELAAEVAKHPIAVSVSARWGSWNPAQLALVTTDNAGLPKFVTFGSGATADANS